MHQTFQELSRYRPHVCEDSFISVVPLKKLFSVDSTLKFAHEPFNLLNFYFKILTWFDLMTLKALEIKQTDQRCACVGLGGSAKKSIGFLK